MVRSCGRLLFKACSPAKKNPEAGTPGKPADRGPLAMTGRTIGSSRLAVKSNHLPFKIDEPGLSAQLPQFEGPNLVLPTT